MLRLRHALTCTATMIASVALAVPAMACTGVIIGGDLTEDGSTIFGRTEDLEQNHPKRLLVHPAGEHPSGTVLTGAETGVTFTQPKDSLKYTSISDVTPEEGRFEEAGFNDKGVAVDVTISATANKEVQKADPYTEKGWTEGFLATVLLANAESARGAVELMASLVDKDGASEGNILVIGDKSELWYMEIYSGHQYAAMKYPADRFSIMPNQYWMNEVNCADTGNFICSQDLEKTTRDAGTYAETNGKFDPARSYNKATMSAGDVSRVWSGIKVLDPGAQAKITDNYFPLLNKPSAQFKKVSIRDVMELQRNRFEGVDDNLAALSQKVVKDSGLKGLDGQPVPGARYPIGNTNSMEAHIFQLPAAGMPTEIPGTLWQTVGTPQGSAYLPYYGNITDTIKPMQSASTTAGDEKSYYWVATDVNLAVDKDRATLTAPVREYLHFIEDPNIASWSADNATLAAKHKADPKAAAAWSTEKFTHISQASYDALLALRESLAVYNQAHTLAATGGHELAVAPGQIILPTVFSVTPDDAAPAPADTQLLAGWNLELTQQLPYGKTRPAPITTPMSVALMLPDGVDPASLSADGVKLLVNGKAIDFQVDTQKGAITFPVGEMGEVALVKAASAPAPTDPVPSAPAPSDPAPTDPVPTTPAPSVPAPGQPTAQPPAPKPGIPVTGTDSDTLLALGVMALAGGACTLVIRRRQAA